MRITTTMCALLLAACSGGGGGGGNIAPTLGFLSPAADVALRASGIVVVTYTSNDPDSDATIDIYADRDGDLSTTGDQVTLALGLAERDGLSANLNWNTTGAATGAYRIVGRISDGASTVTVMATGQVILNVPPTISIAAPAADASVGLGGVLWVTYTDNDPDDAAVTTFFLDADGNPATGGDAVQLGAPVSEANGTPRQVLLDTSAAAAGIYSVVAFTTDAVGSVSDVSAGRITIGDVAFAKRAGGAGSEVATAAVALRDGGTLVGGGADAGAVFGPGEPGQATLANDGLFIARYRRDGTLVRVRGNSGDGSVIDDLALLSNGAVLATGTYVGTTTFGPGEANETTLSATDNTVFLACYEPDGTLGWVVDVASDALTGGVAAFPDGSSVVGWHAINEPTGSITRFSAAGVPLWTRRGEPTVSSGSFVRARAVAALQDGSCMFLGRFRGSNAFNLGLPGQTFYTAQGGYDCVVARYDSSGDILWIQRMRSPADCDAKRVAFLADGGCAVTGGYYDTTTFDFNGVNETSLPHVDGVDMFVARYGPGGEFLWVRSAHGTSSDFGEDVGGLADGSVLVVGGFSSDVTFGAGEPGETMLTSTAVTDRFAARYLPDGTLFWAKRIAVDTRSFTRLAVHVDDSFVVVGPFMDTVTVGTRDLTSAGDNDAYIAQLNPNGDG